MTEGIITLKKGREKPVLQQHPWIFSGAIATAKDADPGGIVTVIASDGRFLARGYWNAKSQIQVRILTWQDEQIDEDWWRRMLKRAIEARGFQHVAFERGDNLQAAYRMINAENDFLPGLVVDRYANWLVLQALTLGIDIRKQAIAEILASLVKTNGIYERSDADVRGKEGLKPATGTLWGESPPEHVVIQEQALQIKVDVRNGHKTGFYLDQSPNRQRLYNLITEDFEEGRYDVLNLFSYTGSFGLHTLDAGGAHIVNVDTSMEALQLAEENAGLNQLQGEAEYIQADVFEYLRDAVERNDQYDVIICDPPKFASNKQQVERAARGYKDLNLHCFKLLKPGGYFMTFSCSGAINPDLFQKIVFGALADSSRQAQIIQHLGPGTDHPVALTFPEGAYLKGLLLRVY